VLRTAHIILFFFGVFGFYCFFLLPLGEIKQAVWIAIVLCCTASIVAIGNLYTVYVGRSLKGCLLFRGEISRCLTRITSHHGAAKNIDAIKRGERDACGRRWVAPHVQGARQSPLNDHIAPSYQTAAAVSLSSFSFINPFSDSRNYTSRF